MKKEYPIMPKELRDNCKLTEENIEKIRELKYHHYSTKEIAEQFNVSKEAIRYWTNNNIRNRHLKYSEIHREKWKNENKDKVKESIRKAYKKKQLIHGKEMYEYRNSLIPKSVILKKIDKYYEKIEKLKNLIK